MQDRALFRFSTGRHNNENESQDGHVKVDLNRIATLQFSRCEST
jgi:hypothetical protein